MKRISVTIGVDVRQEWSCPMNVPDDWPDNFTDDFVRSLDSEQRLDFWEQFYENQGKLVDETTMDNWVKS